ncbi:hypothetical protein V491_09062 [Pseudogymnoascus sp. VKM F-3775]|nr:hypothetical protein V491_09062 [Pseudogymnoascus sp. VKM F-3775]
MAPAPTTEDYYMVLGVGQTASRELVKRSYKRLALKLHPDRNSNHDATEAFQLLLRAYETLEDEIKRKEYDRIYPTINRTRPSPQGTQTPRPPPPSSSQPGALSEAAQIAALEKSKAERNSRWMTQKSVFDSSIFEIQRVLRRLEQQIKDLDSIAAAEAEVEARKNSWGTWLLSPIYKTVEDTEEEKARKDRGRQERKLEKDMKERWLEANRVDLKKQEDQLRIAKEQMDAANLADTIKITAIRDRISLRETRAREERERVEREKQRVERERIERIRKQEREQREKKQREEAEKLRAQRAEQRAAAQRRQEEEDRKWQKKLDDDAKHWERYARSFATGASTGNTSVSTCSHDGWWDKSARDV